MDLTSGHMGTFNHCIYESYFCILERFLINNKGYIESMVRVE